MDKKETKNTLGNFVGLVGTVLGIFVAVAFGVLIFAPLNLEVLVPISWAFTTLGLVIGYFMYKTAKK